MTNEIFIENKRLDISAGISSLLTFSIDDVKDFASRNATFSKTIVLPGTANNNILFGSLFDVRMNNPYSPAQDNVGINFNPSVSAKCVIFNNHIQIFKGTIRILQIVITNNVPEYECAVFGELGGLVLSIGNKKISDLDFSAYDHVLSVANIKGSWSNTAAGYYYPLVDVGGVSVNKLDYDYTAFRPALFVKQYIDKIFASAGYTYESTLFDTTRFEKLIIPHNEKILRAFNNEILDRNAAFQEVIDIVTYDNDIIFATGLLGAFTTSDSKTFTYTGSNTICNITAFLNLTILGAGGEVSLTFRLKINGATVQTVVRTNADLVEFSLLDYPIVTGDAILVNVNGSTTELDYVYVDGNINVFVAVAQQTASLLGDTVKINDTIPKNILQKDFLSSIIKLFNLYVYENSTEKNVVIKPYVDFYDLNVSGILDWNYKVDRSKSMTITPMSEINSRYYNFNFKADTDYYNELYKKRYSQIFGNRIYDSEFQFANENQNIDLIFSPSPLLGYAGKDKIVTPFYKLNAGIEEKNDVNIRILQTKLITGVTSWAIKDGVTAIDSGNTTYSYAGNYDDPDAPANDIHFSVPLELFFIITSGAVNVTQFNVYWSSYMAEITDKDSKLFTCWMKLNSADIFNLNFSKLIYIDGAYWRLNKIEDWNANEPEVCKVELLKVITLFY